MFWEFQVICFSPAPKCSPRGERQKGLGVSSGCWPPSSLTGGPAFEKIRPLVLLRVSAVLKQLLKAWHLYPLGSWAHLGDGESRGSASFRNVSFVSQQLWGGYPDAPLSFFLKLSLKWPWPSTLSSPNNISENEGRCCLFLAPPAWGYSRKVLTPGRDQWWGTWLRVTCAPHDVLQS